MIRLKKLTALLVSAALALSLLAGCGGSKALSQVIADLLSGQYNNVTVEVDPALTAALKKAAAAGDTQEEVLAALVENLNLSGGSITFNNLGDGQQGQHGVTLTFQPGSDPDAAARSAFTEWNRVFSSLPDDGSYRAHVSMIETEGGYYIAVDVEVLKAGTPDKDDPEPKPDYTTSTENGVTTYTVYTAAGLQKWAEAAQDAIDNKETAVNCTLARNIDLENQPWTPVGDDSNAYTGTFDGGKHTISGLCVSSGDYAGLFGRIGEKGTVQNLTLDGPTISSTSNIINSAAGAVAGGNDGAIENCHVKGGTITSASNSGGMAGVNFGTVTGCSSSAEVKGSAAGGVVGGNFANLGLSATVTACYATGSVTATNGSAGGVVGRNSYGPGLQGAVTACYATGTVTATGSTAGGVVGSNTSNNFTGTITACYWSGSVADDKGIGDDTDDPTGEATQVKDENDWEQALTALNTEANNSGYTFGGSMTSPTLKKN